MPAECICTKVIFPDARVPVSTVQCSTGSFAYALFSIQQQFFCSAGQLITYIY